MDWYHEPPRWHIDGDALTLTTAPQTDFWFEVRFEGFGIAWMADEGAS